MQWVGVRFPLLAPLYTGVPQSIDINLRFKFWSIVRNYIIYFFIIIWKGEDIMSSYKDIKNFRNRLKERMVYVMGGCC